MPLVGESKRDLLESKRDLLESKRDDAHTARDVGCGHVGCGRVGCGQGHGHTHHRATPNTVPKNNSKR
jgi:hypothetical protein